MKTAPVANRNYATSRLSKVNHGPDMEALWKNWPKMAAFLFSKVCIQTSVLDFKT